MCVHRSRKHGRANMRATTPCSTCADPGEAHHCPAKEELTTFLTSHGGVPRSRSMFRCSYPQPAFVCMHDCSDITLDTAIEGGGLVRMNLTQAHGSVTGLSFARVRAPAYMHSSIASSTIQSFGLHFTDLWMGGVCANSSRAAGMDPAPRDTVFECT